MGSIIWQTAAAVMVSVGVSGSIILSLSTWLAKLSAKRILQDERALHEQALERLRGQVRGEVDTELERVRVQHGRETDLVLRRREVYERIALALRVFVGGARPATENEKEEFLKAYDVACLWASDEVLAEIGIFIDLAVADLQDPNTIPMDRRKQAYAATITAMRKDSSFVGEKLGPVKYRLVSFV